MRLFAWYRMILHEWIAERHWELICKFHGSQVSSSLPVLSRICKSPNGNRLRPALQFEVMDKLVNSHAVDFIAWLSGDSSAFMTEILTKIDKFIIRDLKIRGEIFLLDVKGSAYFRVWKLCVIRNFVLYVPSFRKWFLKAQPWKLPLVNSFWLKNNHFLAFFEECTSRSGKNTQKKTSIANCSNRYKWNR